MQYLKKEVMKSLVIFCEDAVDPRLSGPMLDLKYVQDMYDRGETIMSEKDPLELMDSIRAVVVMYDMYVDPDGGQRTQFMMGSIAKIYFVFCLGFASICCTMNGRSSIINENTPSVGQILDINQFVSEYPRLSNWVKLSGENWMEAFDEISGVYRNAHPFEMLDPFMFMTGHAHWKERYI